MYNYLPTDEGRADHRGGAFIPSSQHRQIAHHVIRITSAHGEDLGPVDLVNLAPKHIGGFRREVVGYCPDRLTPQLASSLSAANAHPVARTT